MKAEAKKLLADVLESGGSIRAWSAGRNFADYEADRQFRRAVEREFEIIGEALNRLTRIDPGTADDVAGLPRIVSFRNRIIHGYDTVDDATVWGVVQDHLPGLLTQCEALLRGAGEAD